MILVNSALLNPGSRLAVPSPTPPPDYTGDPNLITPGVWGFIAIFVIAVVTVFLIIDMNRRIRRSRYREEVRLQLEAEQAEADKKRQQDF